MTWLGFHYHATTLADESGCKATAKPNTEAKKEIDLASIRRQLIAPIISHPAVGTSYSISAGRIMRPSELIRKAPDDGHDPVADRLNYRILINLVKGPRSVLVRAPHNRSPVLLMLPPVHFCRSLSAAYLVGYTSRVQLDKWQELMQTEDRERKVTLPARLSLMSRLTQR